jgi:hypothetical protein
MDGFGHVFGQDLLAKALMQSRPPTVDSASTLEVDGEWLNPETRR